MLGVSPGASAEQIRSSYQRLARVHHPDRQASSSGHGVYHAKPPRELIESLDALFRGEHPPVQQDLFAGAVI